MIDSNSDLAEVGGADALLGKKKTQAQIIKFD